MSVWDWIIVIEDGALALFVIYRIADELHARAAWRRFVMHSFTTHPIANLMPPTVAELRRAEWLVDTSDVLDRN